MQDTPDQTDFKPPRHGRWSMPMVLALLAHLALIAALTWGVHWQKNAEPVAFEAELWSSVAQEAAPRAVKPPPPPPEPKVEPKVEPKPKPEPPRPEPKAEPQPPDTREADIAIEQAKKKKEQEEAKKREAEKKEAAKKKADEAKAHEEEKKKKADEAKRKEDQRKLDDKIKQLAEKKKRKAQEEASAKAARDEQMRRIMGQADATGGENAKGTAQRASGPSSGYAGRVNAAVRPNVLLTEDIPGNPKAEIDVQSAPDGTIISRRLSRSSGNPTWDRAALAAIDRTGKMPRDVDGRVPSPLTIVMRPRD